MKRVQRPDDEPGWGDAIGGAFLFLLLLALMLGIAAMLQTPGAGP